MATPHVAGAVALMLQARPALGPEHVIAILEGTADDMPAYEIFEVGMGHLDALEAVQAAERGKIKFPPPINGATPEFTRLSAAPIEGVAMTNTWALVEQEPASEKCVNNDATALDDNLYSHHQFTIQSGTDVVYAEIDWNQGQPWDTTGPTDLIYLRLYAPDCTVAAESAALLDIGSVNHRAVLVTSPVPGTWTVGVYGRVNAPNTPYTGLIGTYDKN
jgi:serine protease AprX